MQLTRNTAAPEMPGMELAKALAVSAPAVLFGFVLAELLTAYRRASYRLALAVRPLVSFAHLKPHAALSFALAFISPTAAYTMLRDLRDRGEIGTGEMYIAIMLNSFPAILMHWPYLLPPLLGLLGAAGLTYFLILVGAGLAKTAFFALLGRLLLPPPSRALMAVAAGGESPPLSRALTEALRKSWRRALRVIANIAATMAAVELLARLGAFSALAGALGGIVPLRPEALAVIAAHMVNPISAYATAAGLCAAGAMGDREVVAALVLGNVLSAVPLSLRVLLPYFVGIFGVRDGVKILLIQQGAHVAFTLLAALPLLL
ncbi:MAG: hypothetical protein LM577_01055 [Thermoproteaceae archaeon]|nr:hypothetical protein [Thermoproteaceae archaeon]